jgi:hypothetical protein
MSFSLKLRGQVIRVRVNQTLITLEDTRVSTLVGCSQMRSWSAFSLKETRTVTTPDSGSTTRKIRTMRNRNRSNRRSNPSCCLM